MINIDPVVVDCPTCAAPSGHRCHTRNGFIVRRCHEQRWAAWLTQLKDEQAKTLKEDA